MVRQPSAPTRHVQLRRLASACRVCARAAQPAYHSAFNDVRAEEVAGLLVLPLKSRVRGPAALLDVGAAEEDIVDEAIKLFRANVLFRTFEVMGGADRVLIYLTLFIHQCLKKLEKVATKAEAARVLSALASGAHYAPGDAGWPLGTVIAAPRAGTETDQFRAYLKQLRETLAPRLLDRIYTAEGAPNKHWFMFSKRKFLNKEFP